MRKSAIAIALTLFAIACDRPAPADDPPDGPQAEFWANLQSLCGRAWAGELVDVTPGDTVFPGRALVMHVRQCSEREVRIPFHVGENHSRTWIVTRLEDGLRLKHDHRHEDGSEDDLTQYGGDTQDAGTATTQEFHADEHTITLLPEAATNIWTMELRPGTLFAYALRRVGTERRVRVEFDLTREVDTPPTPWGH